MCSPKARMAPSAVGGAARPDRARRGRRACAGRRRACRRARSARPAAAPCRRWRRPAPCPRRPARWRSRAPPAGRCGTPTQKGAVEKRRSVPPKGATSTLPATLTKWMEISPARDRRLGIVADAADMAGVAQRRSTRGAVLLRPLDAERRRPAAPTVWPKPNLPSSSAKAPPSVTTSACWPAHDVAGLLPLDVARHARRRRGCHGRSRLAPSRWVEMRAASARSQPAAAKMSAIKRFERAARR